jgi:hypothetical protein
MHSVGVVITLRGMTADVRSDTPKSLKYVELGNGAGAGAGAMAMSGAWMTAAGTGLGSSFCSTDGAVTAVRVGRFGVLTIHSI